jgi:hypothetical protein
MIVNRQLSKTPDHVQISYFQLALSSDVLYPFLQVCSEQVCERAVLKADWFDEAAYFKVLSMPLIPQVLVTLQTYLKK